MSNAKTKDFFFSKFVSNYSELAKSARNGKNKLAADGGSGGTASVFF